MTDLNLTIQPISLSTASEYVHAWHRHSRPTVGHLWSIGCFDDDLTLHGVAVVGRPVARALDDGTTVEVTRLATDGTRNACSMLYGAAVREARRRGYRKVITYTLASERGSSLMASGFTPASEVKGRQWDTPSRPRARRKTCDRVRWERATRTRKHPTA